MCDPAAGRHTESSSVGPTDLAVALTINKGLFVELDGALVAPLAGVVLADLGADLGGELLLLGNGIRLLQLHALQHFSLDVSRLAKDGGNVEEGVKKVLLFFLLGKISTQPQGGSTEAGVRPWQTPRISVTQKTNQGKIVAGLSVFFFES